MKKLITLILVLTGMVCTAGATDYTVYFKPNTSTWDKDKAWFALYMWNSSSNTWAVFTKKSNGVYAATYDSSYNSGFIFVRLRPSTADGYKSDNDGMNWDNKWNQSVEITTMPTSAVFYDVSSNSNSDLAGLSATLPSVFGDTGYPCIVVADPSISNGKEDWKTSSTVNKMTYQNDFTYTLNVSERFVLPNTYGFKIYRDDLKAESSKGWCGDPDNEGNNFPVTTEIGYYTFAYTYNILTGKATCTPTRTNEVTMKYSVLEGIYNNNTSKWDYVTNLGYMTYDGTNKRYYYTTSDRNLTTTTGFPFKIYRQVFVGDDEQEGDRAWLSGSDESIGWGYQYLPEKNSTYDVTFYLSASDEAITSSGEEKFTGYYLIDTDNSWNAGDALSADGSVYSKTFSGKSGYSFIITPNTNINASNAVISWDDCIRPDDGHKTISFTNFAAAAPETETNKDYHWTVNNSGLPDVTFSYDKDANKWSVTAANASCTIGSAGYATYSMGDKFKVSGADNVYTICANNTETVRVQGWDASTVFPANTGVIIKGTTSATIQAVDVAESTADLGTNYLVGSGNSTADITAEDGIYIFAMESNGLGFYRATSGTLAAHKAYLNLGSSNAREFLGFDFDEGEATGISAAKTEIGQDDQVVYDLQGRKINGQCSKGLYIVNGKKVIIK